MPEHASGMFVCTRLCGTCQAQRWYWTQHCWQRRATFFANVLTLCGVWCAVLCVLWWRPHLQAIQGCDAVVYGMGSVYTSICPTLILEGVGESIAARQDVLKVRVTYLVDKSVHCCTGLYRCTSCSPAQLSSRHADLCREYACRGG